MAIVETDEHIFHYTDGDGGDEASDGWYYSDETNKLHGPYGSRQEAKDMLEGYVRWLNGEAN